MSQPQRRAYMAQREDLNDAPNATMRGAIKAPTLLLMHLLAGRSILTVKSRRTGDYFTFRFSRPDFDDHNGYVQQNYQARKDKGRPIWVSVYGGPRGGYVQNQADLRAGWSFLGTIWPTGLDSVPESQTFAFRRSTKSKVSDTDPAMRACAWIAKRLPKRVDELMEQGEWWHEGVCGRCGRRLTVPESIEMGFGPDCLEKMGLGGVDRIGPARREVA